MSSIAVPSAMPVRRRVPWTAIIALSLALVVVGGIAAGVYTFRSGSAASTDAFYSITRMPLEVTISKDGELSAVNNLDITCPVEGSSTIQWIVKEGTTVKKGDTLLVIDSSDLTAKVESSTLDLQKAEADLTAAKEAKEIQESTNAANLEASNVELILARLDLQQYQEGTYPQSLEAAQRKLEMSKIGQKTKEQLLAQKQGLFGKGFVNSSDVKDAEIALLSAQNDLATAETDLMVLDKYTHEKDLTDMRNKVAQAEKKFVRTQRENASNLSQKVADLQSKEQGLLLRKRQFDNLKTQLESTTIKAPGGGLVVYGSSGGAFWGRRDTPIQAGANIRYQEVVIRLPDTSQMKAIARIQEAQVTKLRVDMNKPMRAQVKIVGVPDAVPGWVSNISVMADSSSRWFNPDAKDYPVDITLASTPPDLKPGVGVETKIFVDRIPSTLAVPLAALYTVGKESYVFVRKPGIGDTTPTKVKVGQVNDTHAQILDGVEDGQQALLLSAGQGRDLLEKAGIKLDTIATTQPLEEMPLPPMAAPPTMKPSVEQTQSGASGGSRGSGGSEGRSRKRSDSSTGGSSKGGSDSSGGTSSKGTGSKDTSSTDTTTGATSAAPADSTSKTPAKS